MGNEKLEKLKRENGWTGLTPEKKQIMKNQVDNHKKMLTEEVKSQMIKAGGSITTKYPIDTDAICSTCDYRILWEQLSNQIEDMKENDIAYHDDVPNSVLQHITWIMYKLENGINEKGEQDEYNI